MTVSLVKMTQSVNTFARLEMPYSEVCMHMGIAGKVFDVEVLTHGMAMLYSVETGRQYCAPITRGEAGVPRDWPAPAVPLYGDDLERALRHIESGDPDGHNYGERGPSEADYERHKVWALSAYGQAVWDVYAPGGWGREPEW